MHAVQLSAGPDDTARRVLEAVEALARELSPDAGIPEATLDSEFEADLGFDSLARTELLLRLQQEFGVRLPDEALLSSTPRDLLRAIERAGGAAEPEARPATTIAEPMTYAGGFPKHASSLIEVLEWHVERHADRLHISFEDDDCHTESLSYKDLYERARTAAGGLMARGIGVGQAVVIMLPSGLEYFYVFFGALMLGAVPVPIYPPARRELALDHIRRHRQIMKNAGGRILVSSRALAGPAAILQAAVSDSLGYVEVHDLLQAEAVTPLRVDAQTLAFLQYTSGSTGDPKGVMLTHGNLLANLRSMGKRAQVSGQDRFVSWLPLYHDMGLIGAWLSSLYYSCPLYLMSPLHFLARPARWLRRIDAHRGTITAAPNFGYELCLNRVDDADLEGIDLSCLRLALNGAEPVRPQTMRRFQQRLSCCGLQGSALKAVYGLAESTVGLTIPAPSTPLRIESFDRESLQRRGEAIPAAPGDPNVLEIVSCGPPIEGQELRIVDATGHELPEHREGSVEFRGPSSCKGYFRNPGATAELFHDSWLVTGDLGLLGAGELFITGRVKDMIIRGGRNIHPTELDAIVGEIDGIRRGCVASFGDVDDRGQERLIVAAETRIADETGRRRLRDQIRRCTVQLLTLPPDDIVLCPPHAIPKTSSGKIRRSDTRELYRRQHLGAAVHRPVRQNLALAAYAVRAELAKLWVYLRTYAYSGYAWALFGLLGPLTWLAVTLLPVRRWRWHTLRATCRTYCSLAGIHRSVSGVVNLPATRNWVLVCNHTSYLDSMMLLQAVPRELCFVAKLELASHWIQRIFLRRLGAIFVERVDPRAGAAAVDELRACLLQGECLAVFPEGTFYRDPRLLPLRMGAFVAAAESGTPVVPVGIAGVRDILRSESWLLRRANVSVQIGTPVEPAGGDWGDAIALRAAIRVRLKSLTEAAQHEAA